MAESVGEVDPRVNDRQGDEILESGHAEGDEEPSQRQLDGVEAVVLRGLVAGQVIAREYLRQRRTRTFSSDSEAGGIDSNGVERQGHEVPRPFNHVGGTVDLAALVSNHRWSLAIVQSETDGDLNDVVPHDGLQALPFRHVIPLELVF